MSRETSLALWERVCMEATDSAGRRDEEQARWRFHDLAARIAARGAWVRPSVGKVSRVDVELDGMTSAGNDRDELRRRTPGRETLVALEARRWQARDDGLIPRDAVKPSVRAGMTPTVADPRSPRPTFDDYRVLGLREVLQRLRPNHPLRRELLAAATIADVPIAGRGAVRCMPPHDATMTDGHALWCVAERRAAMLYRRARSDGEIDQHDPAVESALQRRGTGEVLPTAIRRAMERELGVSLAGVRIHADSVAAQATQALDAEAFTIGEDIFFAAGKYAPDTHSGRKLLTHELTHVAQALRGLAGPTGEGLRVSQPGDPLEREAEAVAERAVGAAIPQAPGDLVLDGTRRDEERSLDHAADAFGGEAVSARRIMPDDRREAGVSVSQAIIQRHTVAVARDPKTDVRAGNSIAPVTSMTFTGHTLTLFGNGHLAVPSVSGLRANNPHNHQHVDLSGQESTDLPDKGPVPEGSYFVKPAEIERKGFAKNAWGPIRLRLYERTMTSLKRSILTKRQGGFFLHQDVKNDGTAGCIGLQSSKDTQAVFKAIEATKDEIPLTVKYSAKVSVELRNAPGGDTPEERVAGWLAQHKRLIVQAESTWRVDRRAIAGAIAWEALENVWGGIYVGARFSGPGKVHYREHHLSEGDPVAKQVEDRGMLPKQTSDKRRDVLASPAGSIRYIGAIMRAFADEARTAGYHIYSDPALLATFFNAWKLDEAKRVFRTKKYPAPLAVNEKMGAWVRDHLEFLETIIGKPSAGLEPREAWHPNAQNKGKGKGKRAKDQAR